MDKEKDKPDAGLRSLDHCKSREITARADEGVLGSPIGICVLFGALLLLFHCRLVGEGSAWRLLTAYAADKNRLPRWRYDLRKTILPFIRWETQYVAWLQEAMRTPALDTYFAMTANLGTHTFFMVVLPILFWCGYTSLARAMIHTLASGVFFSGFFKDMLCLPRPLSPPLTRITMSGSTALEYGFPSTHSTNAISVAVYTLFTLNYGQPDISPTISTTLQIIAYCYGVSIVLGRVYCGMHGFLDVICGSLLGAIIALIECLLAEPYNNLMHSESGRELLIVILIICVLVRIHPEPVDDCPCFDDSVAFAGVMIGAEFANWHFARTQFAWSEPYPSTVPFNLQELGWLIALLRIVLGVFLVFVWRGTMKPTLLRILPPIFRVIEMLGLSLPRRFFKQASQYKRVPQQPHDDNIIPSVSEIPHMLGSFRRRRAVSIGPQSEADAYETMAYREKKRRDSLTDLPETGPVADQRGQFGYFQSEANRNGSADKARRPAAIDTSRFPPTMEALPPAMSPMSPMLASAGNNPLDPDTDPTDKDLFTNLQRPRVRYDVEVVTKIIVYSGIAWIAIEGAPILFEVVGLGMR